MGGPPSPKTTPTLSIVGAKRSIASASSGVRLGRRSNSERSSPAARLIPENCARKIVSGPTAEIVSRRDSSKPRIMDVIPTIDVIPMTTPSTVNPDRIF